ncbi:MAG: nuclear transport factor 2 family protein [Pyrinomonadaceae bacterium]|nr:nuclear transport factor 2 family protein [Pyrinomonadaceae bacterium]
MAENTAKQFIDALYKLESERDLETIVSLFSEDCEIGNVVTEDKNIGVREFWTSYRESFGEVKSTFRNEIVPGDTAALEWTTSGTSGAGNEISYDGVSILEISGDKITRFHAYFDPNKLGKQMEAANNG